MALKNVLDAIGHTPLVELSNLSPKPGVRLFAKLEGHNPSGSVKDRIAKYMVEAAEASGELTRDRIILEATSGNTGISLAMVARVKGYHLTVVMPENVSPERTQMLDIFGAKIVYSEGSRGTNGAIIQVQRMVQWDETFYNIFQYGNAANPLAHYETTGVEILKDLPHVDAFVAGLGTGGTLMGIGRRLKEANPETRVIAAAPRPGDAISGLRSLEEGFIPPILDLKLLDSRIMVDSQDAFQGCRELTEREGIFAGISSGAVLHVAQRIGQRMERGNIVMLLADGGWKYLSTKLWTTELKKLEPDMDTKIWW
ncbi:MAG: cysteine synthase family protein [Chloroflexi bacterium]|nr:cysteine synthase family protein [Chloroflexota bacterium]